MRTDECDNLRHYCESHIAKSQELIELNVDLCLMRQTKSLLATLANGIMSDCENG